MCFIFVFFDCQWSLKKPRLPKNVCHLALYDRQWSSTKPQSLICFFYLFLMIVNDLLQSLGRLKMYLVWFPRWSMIFYKTSDAQICYYLVSLIVNDLLNSLGHPKMFSIWSLWSSMISYKASVAQMCFLFVFYDRQLSLTKPRSPKNVSHLDSMIFNDLLQILGRPNMCPHSTQWSSMISYNASVAQMCFFYLFSMIVNDLFNSLGRSYFFFFFFWSSMISYKALVAQIFFFLWSSMICYEASVAQIYFLFVFYDCQWFL